jgi:TolB protein
MLKKNCILFFLFISLVSRGQKTVLNGNASIAFASFGPLNTDLFLAEADGSNPRPVLPHPELDYNASFSAKGNWIVFTSERNGSPDIFRVHPDGSGLETLIMHPAFDDQGALSPDGKFLAFVSSRSEQADIWVLELSSKKLRNITNHAGGDFRPSWSPDGKWIAFSSDRNSLNPKQTFVTLHSTELYLVRPDGSGLQRITDAQAYAGSPAWSLDGRRLVYYAAEIEDVRKITSPLKRRGTCQVVSLDLQTKERKLLTTAAGEKWSPHFLAGDKVGYTSGGPEGGIEFTTGTAGSRGEFKSPSWSPDGRYMVFHREVSHHWPPVKKSYTLDKEFELVRTGIFPSFTQLGDRLICNDQTAAILRNSVLVMNRDGSNRSILFTDTAKSILAPVWSPKGNKIAFSIGRFFQASQGRSVADLAIIDTNGTNLIILTDSSGNYGFPSWSPDGKQIVFRASGDNKNGLFIINVATKETRALAGSSGKSNLPSWSPDGTRIAFTSNESGDYEIYTTRPDGTDLKRLTNQPGSDAHSSWSPDGKWIAFVSIRGGFKDEALLYPNSTEPSGDIYVMRSDGTGIRRLTDNQHLEGTPAWIPAIKK